MLIVADENIPFADEVFSLREDQCIHRLLHDSSPYMAGVDEETVRTGCAVRLAIPDNPYAKGFPTPSGKVEFYSQTWADRGLDPLPDGRPIPDPEGRDDFPLSFITPPHRRWSRLQLRRNTGARRWAFTSWGARAAFSWRLLLRPGLPGRLAGAAPSCP